MTINDRDTIQNYKRNLLICCFFWILMFLEIKYAIFLKHIPFFLLFFLSFGLLVLPIATLYNFSLLTSELFRKTLTINHNLKLFSASLISFPIFVIAFYLLVSTSKVDNLSNFLFSKEFGWDGLIIYNFVLVVSFFYQSKQSSLLHWSNSNIFLFFASPFIPQEDENEGWECKGEFMDRSWEFFECDGVELNYSNIIKYEDYIFNTWEVDTIGINLVNFIYILLHILPVLMILIITHKFVKKRVIFF